MANIDNAVTHAASWMQSMQAQYRILIKLKGNIMNMDRIEGTWKQYKSLIKFQLGKLMNDQFIVMESRRDKQEGIDQESYGIARDEIPKKFAKWQAMQKNK